MTNCLEQDVVTAAKREWMIDRLEGVVAELEGLFRTRARTGNLVLSETTGKYSNTYNSLGEAPTISHQSFKFPTFGRSSPIYRSIVGLPGLNTEKECAKDARLTYRLPVNDEYCEVGFDADVLFFPTFTQWSPFTGGFGGDTASDQYGRPIMITMGWAPPANGFSGAVDEYNTNSSWNNLFDGANLGIVGPNWNDTLRECATLALMSLSFAAFPRLSSLPPVR